MPDMQQRMTEEVKVPKLQAFLYDETLKKLTYQNRENTVFKYNLQKNKFM